MMKWAVQHSISDKLDGCLQITDTGSLALTSSASGPDSDHPLTGALKKRRDVLTLPMSYDDYPSTEAICMTGYTELGWLGQLVKSKVCTHDTHDTCMDTSDTHDTCTIRHFISYHMVSQLYPLYI